MLQRSRRELPTTSAVGLRRNASLTKQPASLAERLAEVERRGWAEFCVPDGEDSLELALTIGRPVSSRVNGPILDRLRPTPQQAAHPHSMSAVYGLGSLPFHTDGAYMPLPPRYVLLRLSQGALSDRPTLLCRIDELPLSAEDLRIMRNDVWLVEGGRRHFYTTILNDTVTSAAELLRFDPCCMRPACSSFAQSNEILAQALDAANAYPLEWSAGRAVLIDNWRVLHARAAAAHDGYESTRILERVLIC